VTTIYLTYRDGAGEVEARIKAAVTSFYRTRGRLPDSIVVNPTELEAARAAIEVLALNTPIESVGGCLVPEVWLAVFVEEEAGC